MANLKPLYKTVKRTKRQLKKQENKFVYAKELIDKLAAKDEIERLKSKLIRVEQAIIFERAKRKSPSRNS